MGWVGLGWFHYSKSTKKWKGLFFDVFRARLDKIWLQQEVKFAFVANLTGTGNRSEGVIK